MRGTSGVGPRLGGSKGGKPQSDASYCADEGGGRGTLFATMRGAIEVMDVNGRASQLGEMVRKKTWGGSSSGSLYKKKKKREKNNPPA